MSETPKNGPGPAIQCHEVIGTTRIYNTLDYQEIPENIHTHNATTAINTHANERARINQNDTRHGIKSLRDLFRVCTSPRYKMGVAWHEQLAGKVEPILTYVCHALINCGTDPDVFREKILVCVQHYS